MLQRSNIMDGSVEAEETTYTAKREAILGQRREQDRTMRDRETAEERDARFVRRREQDRTMRDRETAEEREARLVRRREQDTATCMRARETAEEREARLVQRREQDRSRRARKTAKEREARLLRRREQDRVRRERRSEQYKTRRAQATSEERAAKLVQRREQDERTRRSQEARQARIDDSRSIHRRHEQLLLFQQAAVNAKITNFHSKLASLEFRFCTSCLERFPNLTMAAHSTECSRCSRDTRIPKLYSPANNMDPGPVPPQLQVHVYN